ncbi:uncharacterized protein FA14DRAFT_186246 [Meira miltonrushii]|uniref:CoA-dependent acyltransferase n=1 Tax=Meira miltonrushii TaxID=1280837 RepID=A0A316V401_9BASI|nr:uncharacterized protein FA14DRAFT_186246 [Meira miltonrushii]PWN31728.1 hypothetical protein FA14DRAFT_186246 [Meira miltonrushii]
MSSSTHSIGENNGSSNKPQPDQAQYEWQILEPDYYQREVVGGEKMFDFLERSMNGHGEGCIVTQFETKGQDSQREMIARIQNGFLKTYLKHPLIGCTLETELRDPAGSQSDELNKVTYLRYRKPTTASQAQQLVSTHINFPRLKDPADLADFVLNGRVGDGDGRRASMYVCFGEHKVSVAYYLSHVIFDPYYGAQAYDEMMGMIASSRGDTFDPSIVLTPIPAEEMQRRLPVSVSFAYDRQMEPTEEDKQKGVEHWQDVLMDAASKDSILIPSDGDAAFRKNKRSFTKVTLSQRETKALNTFCKSVGMPLVGLMGASYLYTLSQEYGAAHAARGEEVPEGIKCTLPLPVQQFIEVNRNESHGPVSCAMMPGLIWVPTKDASVLEIAMSLGQATQAQITHPHPLGREAMDTLLMPYLSSVASTSSVYLPPGFPGLTYIGNVSRFITERHSNPGLEMTLCDVYMGTRSLTNRPWMLGSVWNGKFSAEIYFNERYLDYDHMTDIVQKTVKQMLECLPEQEEGEESGNHRQSRL